LQLPIPFFCHYTTDAPELQAKEKTAAEYGVYPAAVM